MRVRRHIAALALFGVQLLQGVLPAAGAACERQTTTAITASVADTPLAIHHHGAPDYSAPDHGEPDSSAPIGAPESTPVQLPHAPAACPMAMACTVVGVTSSAVAVTTVDVAVDVHCPLHVAGWPVSLDIAPEPPPPRG